ncbi:hypothetical protein H4219_004658, partial [Mycoemilia scoparia]
ALANQVKKFVLNNKTEIPSIGIGTWQQRDPEKVKFVIKEAIKVGYRHIDTATVYRNEEAIGQALTEIFSDPDNYGVERKDIWITSKLSPRQQGYQKARDSVEESLKNLNLDYIDLYLIHWPGTSGCQPDDPIKHKQDRKESWRALEDLYYEGKVKAIGVSNYLVRHLQEFDEYARVLPTVNQCEFHPLIYDKELLDYCKKKGIQFEAYSSLGEGNLINGKEDVPELDQISSRRNISAAKILLKWGLQHDIVVIPKASSTKHLIENFQLGNFELTEEEMEMLNDTTTNATEPTSNDNNNENVENSVVAPVELEPTSDNEQEQDEDSDDTVPLLTLLNNKNAQDDASAKTQLSVATPANIFAKSAILPASQDDGCVILSDAQGIMYLSEVVDDVNAEADIELVDLKPKDNETPDAIEGDYVFVFAEKPDLSVFDDTLDFGDYVVVTSEEQEQNENKDSNNDVAITATGNISNSDSVVDVTEEPQQITTIKKTYSYILCTIVNVVCISLLTYLFNLHAYPPKINSTAENARDIRLDFPFIGNNPNRDAVIGEDQYPIRLIHTNDVHAHYDAFGLGGGDCSEKEIETGLCFGGAPRLKYIINKLREQANGLDGSMLVDAGDQFQGTLFFRHHKGYAGAKVMNNIGYDAMTLGNHEFDEGPEVLSDFISQLNFPVVSSNIDASRHETLHSQILPYTIIERHNLAIVGFTTESAENTSKPGPKVKISDPVPIINDLVRQLKSQGINKIIALSHMGYSVDLEIAKRLDPGVSLLVGGHSHTFLTTDHDAENVGNSKSQGRYPTIVENESDPDWKTYVIQSKKWGEYISYLDLVYDKSTGMLNNLTTGQPIRTEYDIPEDQELRNIVDELRVPFDREGKVIVGYATEMFNEVERLIDSEQATGRLVCDAYTELCRNNPEVTKDTPIIPAGLFYTGGIRSGIREGKITVSDVISIMPFENLVVAFNVTGKVLIDTFKKNLKETTFIMEGDIIASVLQMSGLKAHFMYNPETNEKTLESLMIAKDNEQNSWEPVDESRVYTIASMDYIVEGGDDFYEFPQDQGEPKYIICGYPTDALKAHIIKNSPISPNMYGENRLYFTKV